MSEHRAAPQHMKQGDGTLCGAPKERGNSYYEWAYVDCPECIALRLAAPQEGETPGARPCLKKYVTCDADEGGPETWCANCRSRLQPPADSGARPEEERLQLQQVMIRLSVQSDMVSRDAYDWIILLLDQVKTLRENEGSTFERLSMALTGGNAATWDQVFHAAESAEAEKAHRLHLQETLVTRLEQIAKRIAATDDPFEDFEGNGEACRFCFGRRGEPHTDGCLWIEARAALNPPPQEPTVEHASRSETIGTTLGAPVNNQ